MKTYSNLIFDICVGLTKVTILMVCMTPSLCQSQEQSPVPVIFAQYESIKPEIVQQNTRLLAWKLGTNLGWTFALRFRYPPQLEDKLFQSLEKTNSIAKTLGISEITWPEARGARARNTRGIIDYPTNNDIADYLAELTGTKSVKSISNQLIRKYGDEHAFYFNIAMKCMLAYIFYDPNSRDDTGVVNELDETEAAAKRASGDPNFQSVWKPVVDAIKQSLSPDVVFRRIQEMDNKMSHTLANDQRN